MEGPRKGGITSEACQGSKRKGDKICPTGKAFNVIFTGDHGAVSVKDIADDEQD